MNNLNRWQRIAIVLAAVWAGAVVYFSLDSFPSRGAIVLDAHNARVEERDRIEKESEPDRRQCDLDHPDSDFKQTLCRVSVKQMSDGKARLSLQLISGVEALRLEELPTDQAKAAGKILALAILPPLLIYLAVGWIARAPRANQMEDAAQPEGPGTHGD